MSGLTIRKYLKTTREFELTYKYYYRDADVQVRLAFLLSGPVNILEELDENLILYLAHTPVYRHYLYIIVPIIEESYRNYLIRYSGESIEPANLGEHESLFINDSILDYYERLIIHLKFVEELSYEEIRRICGSKNDFYLALSQILTKLRTVFRDVNPHVVELDCQQRQGD